MKLEIGDTLYEIEFTVNAVCDLEELTKKSIGDVLRLPELSGIRALLWCGLIEGNPSMTFKQAGKLLDTYLSENGYETGKERLNVALAEAISQAGFLQAQGTKSPK